MTDKEELENTINKIIDNRIKKLKIEQKSIEGSPEWLECQACIIELNKVSLELIREVK